MKKNGSTALRIAGILEILIGAGAIALTLWILSADKTGQTVLGLNVAKEALETLVMIYAIAGFRIISGLIALIFAGNPKHYGICSVIGMLLVVLAVTTMSHGTYVEAMIADYLSLLVPCIYLYGAIKNKNYYEAELKK